MRTNLIRNGDGHFYKKNNKWCIRFYYTNYVGEVKRKTKEGFRTKEEAKDYRDEYIRKEQGNTNMTFESLYQEYKKDVYVDLKVTTIATKNNIIELHILPFFKDMKVDSIDAKCIKTWQNLIKKKDFADSYLMTINLQLNSIFNYAIKYYNLPYNPCMKVGMMGKKTSGNLAIWSETEMQSFLDVYKDEPIFYYAYYLLWATGIRLGELLALKISDVDLENKYVNIDKTLTRVGGEDLIGTPKTESSKRRVYLSNKAVEKMTEYINMLYKEKDSRLFDVTKTTIEKKIKIGADKAGLPPIRVHDIRHSHASLLISKGVDIATLSKRLGHAKITTTLNVYGHMYDSKAREAAELFDKVDL